MPIDPSILSAMTQITLQGGIIETGINRMLARYRIDRSQFKNKQDEIAEING